jgi:hypothetical protein
VRAPPASTGRRGKRVKTTFHADRHHDLVNPSFSAAAPKPVVGDELTFVPTWTRVSNACFIVDAYVRMIVGWRVPSIGSIGDSYYWPWLRPPTGITRRSRSMGPPTPVPGRPSRTLSRPPLGWVHRHNTSRLHS